MSYSVTGMTAAPDVGFKAERRITARGAKALAVAFLEEGRRDVEIRDDRGQLLDDAGLDRAIMEDGASEADVSARFAV